MFDTLPKLTKAAVGVIVLPVDAAADIITLGGALSDQDKPYIAQRAEQIMDNLKKASDGG